MALGYRAANPSVQNNQLKIQELVIRAADTNLYVNHSGTFVALIGESVATVVAATQHVDAGPTNQPFAQASLSVVDSVAYTSGGNMNAIAVSSATLATNDTMTLRYTLVD